MHPVQGSLAAQPWRAPVEPPSTIPPSEQYPQGRLFADGRRGLSGPKVIPFERFAPGRPQPQAKPGATVAPRSPGVRTQTRAQRPPARKPPEQPMLDFLPSASAAPRKLGTTVEAAICCEFPVATLAHRAVAAALDWSMMLIGYALFLGAFYLAGGDFVLTRPNVIAFGTAYVFIAMFYGMTWAFAGTETPGMRWAHLRLSNFDGFPPERHQRFLRCVTGWLSVFAAGIGVLWALADEENLAWHDHISRTFPTLRDTGSSPVVRRS